MSDIREITAEFPDLPESMQQLAQGRIAKRNVVGMSGGTVYRLCGTAGEPDLYLKQGSGSVATDITDEMVRLNWLEQYISVPQVIAFTAQSDQAWLLMSALTGRTAYQRLTEEPEARPQIVDALAGFLRQIHTIPAQSCPFNSDHHLRLAQQVWDDITALLPLETKTVVTHGDFSLDNILMDGNTVTGCIDTGRVGLADPYQDLAILWDCLGEFSPALQDRLFPAYDITAPDQKKLRFHLGLDEFF
jgi:aminoglycoside 3'-phosphotransferase-1